ncbi:MAG: hypothetical protein ACYTFT_09190, partial [Planctomycetota bacterium]
MSVEDEPQDQGEPDEGGGFFGGLIDKVKDKVEEVKEAVAGDDEAQEEPAQPAPPEAQEKAPA